LGGWIVPQVKDPTSVLKTTDIQGGKANKGATGVDDESIEDFEKNLKNNLYKIWKIKVNIQWMLYCMVHNIEEIMNFAMA
jgi:retron-type reverse transcriptase